MQSNDILTSLLTDLQTYQETNLSQYPFIFEDEIQDDSILNDRFDNPCFVVGMDESDATVNVRTQQGISNFAEQGYDIKIFMVIPREGDYVSTVARPIRDVKDMILNWINQPLNVSGLTTQEIFSMEYISNTSVTRTSDYATLTISLSALRQIKQLT